MLSKWFISNGHNARHTNEITGGLTLTDTEIWKIAKKNGEIIVTKDLDFFEKAILNDPPPQVCHIAFGNCSNKLLIEVLEKQWKVVSKSLQDGVKLISITRQHINIYD